MGKVKVSNVLLFLAAGLALLSIYAAHTRLAKPGLQQTRSSVDENAVESNTSHLEARLNASPEDSLRSPAEAAVWAPRRLGYSWDPLRPGIAADELDANWLDSHGFPDEDVYRELMILSIAQLMRQSRLGNQSAAGVLAYRLARAGDDPGKVEEILLDGAANGSAYSLKAAADIYTSVEEFRHLPTAYAYNSLRFQLGDHSALGDNFMISGGFSNENYLEAQLISAALSAQLERRNPTYFRLLGPPRPGFENFIDQALRNQEGF